MKTEKIELIVHGLLSKTPRIRHFLYFTYQVFNYLIFPKVKKEGDIRRISPKDSFEYFFGYYDKSPWNKSEKYMLCMKVLNTCSETAPVEKADIMLINTQDNNFLKLSSTNAWNVQQGSMLQWLGPDYSSKIIFNDYRNGDYCSVILNLKDKTETKLDLPIYDVDKNCTYALTLDFSRLHRLRPGYGYSNKMDITNGDSCPKSPCIWKIDIEKNYKTIGLFSYYDLFSLRTRTDMLGAEHKVNHIMINPSGTKFIFFHRWVKKSNRFTRLMISDPEGNHLDILSDDDFISHCYWIDDEQIVSYQNRKGKGKGYYLINVRTKSFNRVWPELVFDGHPSLSPDRKYFLTDTYPNRRRMQSIYLMKGEKVHRIVQVFSPFKYRDELRCDLHPRWDRSGKIICFDATFEGTRAMYIYRLGKEEI